MAHYCQGMARLALIVPVLYLLFALIGRYVELIGGVTCECRSDCWCKKPVLSTFRWVFPLGHVGEGCS